MFIKTGWGLENDNALFISRNLRFVDLPIVNNTDCAKTYGQNVISESHLCVSGRGGKSTCSGDSGK